VSTFTAEALASGEIIEKINSEQNFEIFSDTESVLKGTSNTYTMNKSSHITPLLKDKIERVELRGKNSNFFWIPGNCGLEVNEKVGPEAKQSIKEGRDSQIVKPCRRRKAKRNFTLSVKTPKGKEEVATLKDDSSPWFSEIKMNHLAFVSINRMRADDSSLKTSLSRFNIVPTAECEPDYGLQTRCMSSGIVN
jgi:hypothetical protein